MDELSFAQEYSYAGLQGLFVIGSVGRAHEDVVGHFREHQTDIDSTEGGCLEGVHDRLGRHEVRGLEIDVLFGVLQGPFVAQLEDRERQVRFVRDYLDKFVPERRVGGMEIDLLFCCQIVFSGR